MKVIIKRDVRYTETVCLEVPNATCKKDLIEAILQEKDYSTFSLNVIEPEKIYTYHFDEIDDNIKPSN